MLNAKSGDKGTSYRWSRVSECSGERQGSAELRRAEVGRRGWGRESIVGCDGKKKKNERPVDGALSRIL